MQWIRDLTVRWKIITLVGIIAFMLLTTGIVGYTTMKNTVLDNEKSYTELANSLDSLGQIISNDRISDSYMLEAILTDDDTYREELVDNI